MKKHHLTIKTAAALGLLIGAPLVQSADTFTGFSMDFVNIGNAGNTGETYTDWRGNTVTHGGVNYNYRMGKYEVSRGMIDTYNANSGGPTLTLADMTPFGANGTNRPATGVSWNEAARFVNWLNTNQGHAAAYKFTTGGANDNIALWEVGDAGYDASNPFRNSNAHYFLPSEDEWYKAAYYDGDTETYYDYATGSDTAPTTTSGGVADGTAVFSGQSYVTGPADTTNAGGLSPYGTMAQNGNVFEWGESGYWGPNDSTGESRVFRGGAWYDGSIEFQSSFRDFRSPTIESNAIGFRVAAVPEPSGVTLLVIGAVGLMMKRKRG